MGGKLKFSVQKSDLVPINFVDNGTKVKIPTEIKLHLATAANHVSTTELARSYCLGVSHIIIACEISFLAFQFYQVSAHIARFCILFSLGYVLKNLSMYQTLAEKNCIFTSIGHVS